jgi:hypothetical protein
MKKGFKNVSASKLKTSKKYPKREREFPRYHTLAKKSQILIPQIHSWNGTQGEVELKDTPDVLNCKYKNQTSDELTNNSFINHTY